MAGNMKGMRLRRAVALIVGVSLVTALFLTTGCKDNGGQKKLLNPKEPVTITVWHYYNGAIMNAFDSLVNKFNETIGLETGIIVEGVGMGHVSELERAVLSSAASEVGSLDMPHIFASYADTAYAAEKLGLLANLDDYFTAEEQKEYLASYVEEGRIGLNGELRIFPIAKATEAMMINETDWQLFAEEHALDLTALETMEGVAEVAELYYDWSGGKAFFGRDVMANLFISASKQFGTEIFKVEEGSAVIDINSEAMRRIWDYYYVPYIDGRYYAYGKFRSDDAKVGDILAYVGSTSSAAYFPSEIVINSETHPVEASILPVPVFEGAERVMIQQGAGMVVAKSDERHEYASVAFLKWFTDLDNNIWFSALSGYMPVKTDALDFDKYMTVLNDSGHTIDDITKETVRISLESISKSELYTNKAFDGGAAARAVLENNLQNKAAADREAVLELMSGGSTREQAVAVYNTDENFESWLLELSQKLEEAASL